MTKFLGISTGNQSTNAKTANSNSSAVAETARSITNATATAACRLYAPENIDIIGRLLLRNAIAPAATKEISRTLRENRITPGSVASTAPRKTYTSHKSSTQLTTASINQERR